MSQHKSLQGANGIVRKRNVLKRFERLDLLKKRGQWKAGETAWTPQARLIFAELELADGARRSLLESPTFRLLLEEKPALAAAA